MRRFTNSHLGKAVCHLVALALVLPFFSIISISGAYAQLQTLPTWAVTDFEVRHAKGRNDLGSMAAEAVANELAKTGKYDVVPQETMKRTMETLTFQPPVTDKTSLLRLAAEVRATTIVRGEVVNWQVRNTAGGKQADVLLRVIVVDVASGLPVNGAALAGSSSVRAASTDDTSLIAEAMTTAANKAVSEINSKTLPQATILNTYENTALINHGTRSGFMNGQEVIVLRGREQVATASVYEVEPDSAMIRITKPIKGHAPGDKVRVVVSVPDLKDDFAANGGERVIKPKQKGSNSGFTTLLVVLGVLGVLFSQGRSEGFKAAHNVKSEAMLYPDSSGEPAVRLSWSRDLFARGNSQTVRWQVWRQDVLGSPVVVVTGDQGSAVDTATARDVTFSTFARIGGNTCDVTELPDETATGVAGVVAGRPYNYQVELVYKVQGIDLPGGEEGEECFFLSTRVAAQGLATPLARPQQVSPTSNQVVSTDIPFTFNSVVNPAFPMTAQYSVQVSSDPTFPGNRTKVYGTVTRADTGILSTGSISNLIARLNSDFPGVTDFWWRIGAKNVADRPGPVPDASGSRFIYSPGRRFTIPAPPPPPPAEQP